MVRELFELLKKLEEELGEIELYQQNIEGYKYHEFGEHIDNAYQVIEKIKDLKI